MKKDCSEHQNRVLRKLVRSHKPTLPAMSGPMARKATLPFPVGRRTTRSEAAKLRAEREEKEKVSQLSKFDSNSKQSDDSTESTDSQSESKQNPTKTNDNQSETNSPQETVEEKAKKPRKKRISRALFRHDTIEIIKPKKQELLQKTFSFSFKKLVDKSKEIYTKNDELSNDNENDDKNKEDTISEETDCTTEVKNPTIHTDNSSNHNNEERTVHNKRLILDMPSLDSPNSPITNSTQEKKLRLNRTENINNNNSIEKLNRTEQSNKTETNKSVVPVHKKMIAETSDSQTEQVPEVAVNQPISGNVCQIQTNSTQNLAYPFYGIVPTRQPNTALHKQETNEDQMLKYKITIVPDHPKNETSDNRTVPPQRNYPVPSRMMVPQQFKIKSHTEGKSAENQPFPYSYLPPKNPYGYPYHLHPYLPPIQTKNHLFLPDKQFWNPHVEPRNKDHSAKLNMSPKETLKYKLQQNGNKTEHKANLNCTVVKEQNNFTTSKDHKQNKNQLSQIAQNIERLQKHLDPLKLVKSNLEHLKHISQPENQHLVPENIRQQMHPQNIPYRCQESNSGLLNNNHGQKRPAEEPKLNPKRVRFDLDSPQKNIPSEINNFPIPNKTESVIVSPNRLREPNERVIVSNTQSTCSVIKKITTNKNLHTIENILSNKCSKQEVNNNNEFDRIKILNIETITSNDTRYVKQNVPQKSVIINAQSTKIAHIDLTTEVDEDRNTNPLTICQFSDTISLNDNTNRLARTRNTNSDMENTQLHDNMAAESCSALISERHIPKLVKIPEKYLNKLEEPQNSERINNRMLQIPVQTKTGETNENQMHKYALETKASEIIDSRKHKHVLETKASEIIDNRKHKHVLETKASEIIDNRKHKLTSEIKTCENRVHNFTEAKSFDNYALEKIRSDDRRLQYDLQSISIDTNNDWRQKYVVETKASDNYAIKTKESETNGDRAKQYIAETKTGEINDSRVYKYPVETKSVTHIPETNKNVAYAPEINKNDNRGHQFARGSVNSEINDNRVYKYPVKTRITDKYTIKTIENNNPGHQYVLSPTIIETNNDRVYKNPVETNASVKYAVETNSTITNSPETNKNDNQEYKNAIEPKISKTNDKHIIKTKVSDTYAIETKASDNRVPKTKDTAAETDKYAYNDVPLIKLAHTNNNNKLSDVPTELPLNLSLKTVAQNEQTKRQSIIVNNTKIHEPLDISTLTLVKSDEEYNGYLKLLQEKNATGPYLFYKFVTSVRRKNSQPIFDLVTFFSLLKQGKLLEYKNMYNQCNK